MINIETASFDKHSKKELDQLYNIVIKGYELTEEEVWGQNYVRIFKSDYNSLIKKNEILLAKYNGIISGGIHHYPLNKSTYTFSLLATDFKYGGKGIGSTLIKEVEWRAKKLGHEKIQIEVLRVKGHDTASKLRLDSYYKKMGYAYTHSEDCSCKIPMPKYGRLKAPSDFDFYTKVI